MAKEEETTSAGPDWAAFAGYDSPNYTMVPDQLFDEHLAFLSGAELKVLLYIVRRTLGFKKASDDISLSQLLDGITTKDGRRLDSGTGLSRSTLVTALRGLANEKRLVIAERRSSATRGHEATTYTLNLASDPSTKIELGGSENRTSLVRKSNPQERVIQETVLQEADISNIRMAKPDEKSFFQGSSSAVPTKTANEFGRGPLARTLAKRQATTGATRNRQKRYDTERQRILAFIEDFAREFNDQAPLSSSVSRAYNLWHRSGIPIEAFSSFMYEARALTNEYSARVQKTDDKSSGWGPQKNKMAYYFAILEELVGQHAPNHAAIDEAQMPARGNGYSARSQPAKNTSSDVPGSPRRPRTAKKRAIHRPDAQDGVQQTDGAEELWKRVRSSLSDLGTPHDQWLDGARGTERDGKFIISVSDDNARAWIEARLTPAIQRALELSGRAELTLEVTA
jgi:hypothetical protein